MSINIRDRETGEITMVGKVNEFSNINGAGFHNSIYRGKNLGTEITSEQWEAIKSGKFTDLYIGDYWEGPSLDLPDNHVVKYTIAHFDYFYNLYNKNTTVWKHHIIIVPDRALVLEVPMFTNSSSNTKGFKDSDIYVNYLSNENSTIMNTIKNIFGEEHLGTFPFKMSTSISGRYVTYDANLDNCQTKLALLTEQQIFGSSLLSGAYGCNNWSTTSRAFNDRRLQVFDLDPSFAISNGTTGRNYYWLNEVPTCYTSRTNEWGGIGYNGALQWFSCTTTYCGIRPFFCIIDPS